MNKQATTGSRYAFFARSTASKKERFQSRFWLISLVIELIGLLAK
ncbi:hypothetical protein [Chitinophaga caseinilytica]|uniref:Uncharacterized protein n=1 Tax=Chitinophaga caseinilytica TaxID=2267521 RepID=A0ABZ2Z558_9BACT